MGVSMAAFTTFIEQFSDVLWNSLLLFLLVGTGVYFTVRLRGVQVRRFGEGFRRVFGGFTLRGKKADAVVTWLIDLMLGIPHIVLLILISYALGKGFWGVTIGVALTHWPSLARILRAEILQLRDADYVVASRNFGKSPVYIARHHFAPHLIPQMLVGLVLMFPHAILHEAGLTFLGFGIEPTAPAIGVLLSESLRYLTAGKWWLGLFPGLVLLLAVLAFDAANASIDLARGVLDTTPQAHISGTRLIGVGEWLAQTVGHRPRQRYRVRPVGGGVQRRPRARRPTLHSAISPTICGWPTCSPTMPTRSPPTGSRPSICMWWPSRICPR